MRNTVERRDEHGDRIAVVHSYAPGDGELSFVAQDPRTTKAVSPTPTLEECKAIMAGRDGWEIYENGPGTYRARKVRPATIEDQAQTFIDCAEQEGYPTTGTFAAELWGWSNAETTPPQLAADTMTAAGYVPFQGYPLRRRTAPTLFERTMAQLDRIEARQ